MEVINLKKKSIVEVEINGEDFLITLDHYSIDHFQRTNKIGILKFYESLESSKETGEIELTQIIKLLGSLIRYKKNGRIVGTKFLEQFDTFAVVEHLTPALNKALGTNLPTATGESEKK